MGQTRVLFTDATTAEAITALKILGFNETADGGCFLSHGSPIKVYSAWGKARYYPDLLAQLAFTPRIQIHFKCSEDADVTELLQNCAQGFRRLSGDTQLKMYNINTGEEITAALSQR